MPSLCTDLTRLYFVQAGARDALLEEANKCVHVRFEIQLVHLCPIHCKAFSEQIACDVLFKAVCNGGVVTGLLDVSIENILRPYVQKL